MIVLSSESVSQPADSACRLSPCELTMGITALANVIACQLPDDVLDLAAAILTQLGDTLATIAVQRSRCVVQPDLHPPLT